VNQSMDDCTQNITIDPELKSFIENEVLPGLGISNEAVWRGFDALVAQFAPRNKSLLAERDRLQAEIDAFQSGNPAQAAEPAEQEKFLRKIGYLVPEPEAFQIETQGVDVELSTLSGPQLVVPADNARYALNAANARWGSLYDALYGTDAMGSPPPPGPYDATRGAQVIQWAKAYLDEIFELEGGSHVGVERYQVVDGRLATNVGGLKKPGAFRGYTGASDAPSSILLCKNGLHVEICIDPSSPVGAQDPAGVSDLLLESAVSAIMDFEDAVAAVDTKDKVGVYRNWLGLTKGTLTADFDKGGKKQVRSLAGDRHFKGPDGTSVTLKGRALMLVRNVGHLMTSSMAKADGEELPEGIIDAFVTALIGRHDGESKYPNSRTGSIYIVKPKMHGPKEAAFSRDLFGACEKLVGLAPNTIKIGVMDEERRTSLNLAAVLKEVKDRVVFTNTGFLDRTGDEIHTSLKLGPMLRKQDMKSAPWLTAYENNNVNVALRCGFAGRGQIGKGMWTMPDRMKDMLEAKMVHPLSGANTAWVPSPTAATLHAIHYHRIDVTGRQTELAGRAPDPADLLTPPIADRSQWSPEQITEELETNLQGILGYIVRWIELGVGCSKVPDLDGVGLMEDRATCRISSQILSNWLYWKIITEDQLRQAADKMARKVDEQNAGTPGYQPMVSDMGKRLVIDAALELIIGGVTEPNGYTEPVLHRTRVGYKTLN